MFCCIKPQLVKKTAFCGLYCIFLVLNFLNTFNRLLICSSTSAAPVLRGSCIAVTERRRFSPPQWVSVSPGSAHGAAAAHLTAARCSLSGCRSCAVAAQIRGRISGPNRTLMEAANHNLQRQPRTDLHRTAATEPLILDGTWIIIGSGRSGPQV